MNRRNFVLASSSVLTLAACSSPQSPLNPRTNVELPFAKRQFTRIEIGEFSQDPALVKALRTGIAAMRKVANAQSVNSYDYWHNSHWMPHHGTPPPAMETVWNQCRHKVSYFFAWHRGFLVFFERTLRQASGNPKLVLPYWDYYKNPKLPAIFANPQLRDGSPNPLYWPGRENDTVSGLSFAPFDPSVVEFPFGPGRTFEDLVERNPHGHVHDQVGGSMGSVPTAPADPIFWLHHCNIDRLWSAWIAAGGNRKMPPPEALWWQTLFFYNVDRTWRASVRNMNDTKNLGYAYDNVALPVPPPNATLPLRPAVVARGVSNANGPIALRLEPITVEVPVDEQLLRTPSLALELDGVALTNDGRKGGYSFGVYVNLPQTKVPMTQERAFSVGELGSFEVTMPKMGGMMRYDLTQALHAQHELRYSASSSSLLVSFVPFGRPRGVRPGADLLRIAQLRVTQP